jgi:hypothetical protein
MCVSAHGVRADFHVQGLAEHPFEGGRVSRRRPELQFRVSGRPQLQQPIVAAVVEFETRHRLRVAAIEAFGQP